MTGVTTKTCHDSLLSASIPMKYLHNSTKAPVAAIMPFVLPCRLRSRPHVNSLPTQPPKRVEVHDRGLLPTGLNSDSGAGTIPGPVLCLDEFLETEDIRVRRSVELACNAMCAIGVTIIFATHVMSHVEGMVTASLKAPGFSSSTVSGGERGALECRERVVAFTKGRAGELRCVDECTYVRWKRGEEQKRRDRTII